MSERLEEEIKYRLGTKKLQRHDGSSSGCINKGICYSIDNDEKIFVKTNATPEARVMFEGELKSLQDMTAIKTVRVPKPMFTLHNHDDSQASSIVMEFIDIAPLDDASATNLGISLANMHDYNRRLIKYNKRASKWLGCKPPSVKAVLDARKRANDNDAEEAESEAESEEENQFSKHGMRFSSISKQSDANSQSDSSYPERFIPEPGLEEIKQFGYDIPTSCGLIPQQNEWTDDWVAFYARHRLDKSIRSLLSDHGDRELMQLWSQLQLKVDKFFKDIHVISDDSEDSKIVPALLHGDLWSGNAAKMANSDLGVVYDPSSFYGHSEYEFGIVRMFGGFPKSFETAYFSALPKAENFELRNKLYQLFHHLNHWDHFGQGYRPSSIKLMKSLL